MEIQKKLTVLQKIAAAFNRAGLHWALGASGMLYLKGIVKDFHDLDLTLDETDIPRAAQILDAMGARQPPAPNAGYLTHCFLEYRVSGVEIDLMAGLVIVSEGREYAFPFAQAEVSEYYNLNGEAVPLQSVTHWKRCYALMGRAGKVEWIENWERQNQEC